MNQNDSPADFTHDPKTHAITPGVIGYVAPEGTPTLLPTPDSSFMDFALSSKTVKVTPRDPVTLP